MNLGENLVLLGHLLLELAPPGLYIGIHNGSIMTKIIAIFCNLPLDLSHGLFEILE